MTSQKISLPITGMTCANCALTVERTVKKIPEIQDVQVNFATENASITTDQPLPDLSSIEKAITAAGYGISTITLDLPITGMSCANCAITIERVLKRVTGVLEVTVNFANESAHIRFIPTVVTNKKIIEAIEAAGYGVAATDQLTADGQDALDITREIEIKKQTLKFWIGLSFAIPLFIFSMSRDFNFLGGWAYQWCASMRSH